MRASFGQIDDFDNVDAVKMRHTGLKFVLRITWNRAFCTIFMKSALFSGFEAERFGQIAFLSVEVVKIVDCPQTLFKTGKECAFHENCTKRSFQVIRSTFWPNGIFERQSCQNRHTGLECSSWPENSAFSWQFSWKAHCFHVLRSTFWPNLQASAFWQLKTLKNAIWPNSLQNGKTVLFMKIVQNARFTSCAARFEIAFMGVCQNRPHWP